MALIPAQVDFPDPGPLPGAGAQCQGLAGVGAGKGFAHHPNAERIAAETAQQSCQRPAMTHYAALWPGHPVTGKGPEAGLHSVRGP